MHNQTWSICATPKTFFERGDLERTRHSLATWQYSRWRRILAQSFLFQVFLHLCKEATRYTSRSNFLKENSSWKSFWHRNTHENATDFQSWSWTYARLEMNDLSRVIVWCHWWTWTEVMYKDGQTFCLGLLILSPCFIKLGVVRLCSFCVVMQLPELYENKRFRV